MKKYLWLLLWLGFAFFVILFFIGPLKYLLNTALPHALQTIVGWASFIVIVLLLTIPLVRWLQRGFKPLVLAAGEITRGELKARAPVVSGSLSEPVARAFNSMAARVEHTILEQEHLLQLLAHETRTPLARMRFALEAATASKTQEARQQALHALDVDISAIEVLFDETLDMMSSLAEASRHISVEVEPLIMELFASLDVSETLQLQIVQDASAQRVFAHGATIKKALLNLLSNASRHARGVVKVTIAAAGDLALICVEDDGQGIPEPDRAHVLDPFVRLGAASRRDGLGLGLAIASRICTNHGHPLIVTDSALGGARFETRWMLDVSTSSSLLVS